MNPPTFTANDADLAVLRSEVERLRSALRSITLDAGEEFSEAAIDAAGWHFPSWERGFDDACRVIEERARAAGGAA